MPTSSARDAGAAESDHAASGPIASAQGQPPTRRSRRDKRVLILDAALVMLRDRPDASRLFCLEMIQRRPRLL